MKLAVCLILLLLLLVSCGARNASCISLGDETDRLSLLDFKQAISQDPQGALTSWNDSVHFCRWQGVTCSLKHPERVTVLNLTDQGLTGHISPSLGNLTFLQELHLPTNDFGGEIPPSLGRLRRLRWLNLSDNSLQGTIPDDLANCSNLKFLSFLDNYLAGGIPVKFGSLSNLIHLQLSKNNLTGHIPYSLGNLTNIRDLLIEYNHLEGSIPNELGRLSRMAFLALGQSSVSGRIPPAVLNLSSLVYLTLDHTQMDKAPLPSDIGDNLPDLQYLLLAGNRFDGPIPASLANASKLANIDLSHNHFTGTIPTALGSLKELYFLNLENNQLEASDTKSWEFVDALSNCTLLQVLGLDNNRLEGAIPASVGNLSPQLQLLYLGFNNLSGALPVGIQNFNSLIGLALEANSLTNEVPEWIGNLQNLQLLSLPANHFTGPIPSSLGNLSHLSYLYLEQNNFEGLIPPSLGSLQSLLKLDLSDNNIRGSIPKEIFGLPSLMSCELSRNNLGGQLPAEVGNANQLTALHLSSNKLSGEIPYTLGNCDDLQTIEAGWNLLDGGIPTPLGNLKSLRELNLSHNNLSGHIPESLDGLQLLNQLDLSYNHLEGDVPRKGVFENSTALSLHWGLCGGVLELHLPACPTAPSSSARPAQSLLLKTIIPIASMVSLLALIIFIILLRKNKPKQKFVSMRSFGTTFPKVSYKDLAKATENFSPSNLVGRGRYGSVYKGKLVQVENLVAVKVFNLEIRGAQKSFFAECEALRGIRHRNLVSILTACSSMDSRGNDFKALVYEFMPRGNLDTLLHSRGDDCQSFCYLSVAQRLNIAIDTTNAMEYLHHNGERPIVHCDLKPSNILLDDDMNAHVGDFGLARFYKDARAKSVTGSCSTSSIAIKGTIGYVAPEYATGGQITTSGDVYSFGIILLEMFTGRRPTNDLFGDGTTIVNFVERNFPDHLAQIVDAQILEEFEEFNQGIQIESSARVHECLVSVLSIALACTRQSPNERMNMKEVATRMHAIKEKYLGGRAHGVTYSE